MAYSATDGGEACSNWSDPLNRNNYTSNCSAPANGCTIYTTYPGTPAPSGWYSNGVNHWYAAPGDDGLLSTQTTCPAPTPTTTLTATPTQTSTQTPTTTVPTPSPTPTFVYYTYTVKLGYDDIGVCSLGDESVFSDSSTFGSGMILYLDQALTSEVTGYFYVYDVPNNAVYNFVNDSGGTVAAYSGPCP